MRTIDADALQEKLTKKRPGPANARYTEGFNDALLCFKSMIHAAPTIEPEWKKGRWIMLDKGLIVTSYKCSECERVVRDDTGYDASKDYPFCHCGADMRGESGE